MRKIVDKSMLGKTWVAATSVTQNVPGDNSNDDLIQKVLAARGIISQEEITKFLNPSIKEYMPDPSILIDMDKAAGIIADAIIQNKKFAIYGDYDVDGITSTAIFVKYLREIGLDPIWHLPTREGEGYGLNMGAIDLIAKDGVQIIVTVDCGISGINEIKYAKELGIQVVVTDHH